MVSKDEHFISLHADPDAWKGGIRSLCSSCLNEYWKDDRRYCDMCSSFEQDKVLISDKCEYYLKRECPV